MTSPLLDNRVHVVGNSMHVCSLKDMGKINVMARQKGYKEVIFGTLFKILIHHKFVLSIKI